MGRRRHVPVRTCAGCGAKWSKRELMRLVRTLSGSVEVDTTGKTAGRGTYLCHRVSCWESGLRKGRLDHVLRHEIPTKDRESLLAFAHEQYGPTTVPKEQHG